MAPDSEHTDPPAYDFSPLLADADPSALAEHVSELMLEQVYSDLVDPSQLRDATIRAGTEEIQSLFALLSGRIAVAELRSSASLAWAAEVGRLGIPEAAFERAYRIGQQAMWEWWVVTVEQHCVTTGESVAEILRATIPLAFAFVDRMLFQSLAAYHEAVVVRRQSSENRRNRLVEEIVDGTLLHPSTDAERFIAYPLHLTHLAAILDRADQAANRQLADELRTAARAAAALVLERTAGDSVLWLGFREQPGQPAIRAIRAIKATISTRRLAFGEPANGIDGFRSSYLEATRAGAVQSQLGERAAPTVWARDVRIEALALSAPLEAQALVDAELGPLIAADLLTDRTQETLEAWLQTRSNVSAAALLGVHEQTVRNRLRGIEHVLGHALPDRHTELHVALRLWRLGLAPKS